MSPVIGAYPVESLLVSTSLFAATGTTAVSATGKLSGTTTMVRSLMYAVGSMTVKGSCACDTPFVVRVRGTGPMALPSTVLSVHMNMESLVEGWPGASTVLSTVVSTSGTSSSC